MIQLYLPDFSQQSFKIMAGNLSGSSRTLKMGHTATKADIGKQERKRVGMDALTYSGNLLKRECWVLYSSKVQTPASGDACESRAPANVNQVTTLEDEAWLSLVVAIAARNNIVAILLFIVVDHDESVADEQTILVGFCALLMGLCRYEQNFHGMKRPIHNFSANKFFPSHKSSSSCPSFLEVKWVVVASCFVLPLFLIVDLVDF
jgi:hypothetical protein